MNEETRLLVEELKEKPEVLGIVLFGSWARGDNRPGSDVDLTILLSEGYKKVVEQRNNQVFELIYTTEEAAFLYWENNKDSAANLWRGANILYDKNGGAERLRKKTAALLEKGKAPLLEWEHAHVRFNAEDGLRYVESVYVSDPLGAAFMLTSIVATLTETYFDVRQLWVPAPKERLLQLKNIDPKFYALLASFYGGKQEIKEQLALARQMIEVVF